VYADPAGAPALRTALARHLGVSRGLQIAADDIIITNGVQQALALTAQVLLEPGDIVAVEDPGYPPARRAFEAAGAEVVPVPVDDHGLDVSRLPAMAKLVYVTPAHQFPVGVRMSLGRRHELLDWARDQEAAVIEDDYDTDFRFGSRPIDALHTIDHGQRVVYVGSFSKTMLPTLRTGYCVAPAGLVEPLRRARYVADWHGVSTIQLALAGFIDEGSFAAHVRRMRREYEKRRDRIVMILERDFGDVLRPIPSAAGLHVSAWCVEATQESVAGWLAAAREHGVALQSFGMFAQGVVPPGLVFGFGAIPFERIEEGLGSLRQVITEKHIVFGFIASVHSVAVATAVQGR
jgi:GntR family transcriptional regulator/MocR family aminotransferase